jgi:hypothetical protein
MLKDLRSVDLPKWPQMLVTGAAVTVEQAKEIIFRTDDTMCSPEYAGNDHEWRKWFSAESGFDEIKDDWGSREELRDAVMVSTGYVKNDWAASSYAYGPHGWCHPDGTICSFDNIGKWPSVTEVLGDWAELAKAFPFLDLHVTLMSGEHCEDVAAALVNIRVVNGVASLEEPTLEPHATNPKGRGDITDHIFALLSHTRNERGLPTEWYVEYAARIKGVIAEIVNRRAGPSTPKLLAC